jgi:ATP-dependent protease ClpP protease subunit
LKKTQINTLDRTIFFHQNDNDGMSVDHNTVPEFITTLHELNLENHKPIDLYMISADGGDWGFGMSMYSDILNSPSPITVYGSGFIGSMATIIMQAAKYRFLCQHTIYLVHTGSFSFDGEAKSGFAWVEANKLMHRMMIDIYANRCVNGEYFTSRNNSVSKVKSYLDQKIKNKTDWYMSAEEAVYMGFADGIY